MAFVAGDYVDLIAFDRAFERRFRFDVNDATAQLRGHLMRAVLVEIEFLPGLLARQIETHHVRTQVPLAQRPMMAREDRIGQIVKIVVTSLAVIAAPFTLALRRLQAFGLEVSVNSVCLAARVFRNAGCGISARPVWRGGGRLLPLQNSDWSDSLSSVA